MKKPREKERRAWRGSVKLERGSGEKKRGKVSAIFGPFCHARGKQYRDGSSGQPGLKQS